MTLLDQLRRAIDASGLNQPQIAERAGISQAAVSRILAGKREPSLDVAERLAKACGRSLVLKK